MVEKPCGDPAPQLTREDVRRLHAAMTAAEPDWMAECQSLASELDRVSPLLPTTADYEQARTVVNEFYRDREAWHRLADRYFEAVGGPISELLPLEDDFSVDQS